MQTTRRNLLLAALAAPLSALAAKLKSKPKAAEVITLNVSTTHFKNEWSTEIHPGKRRWVYVGNLNLMFDLENDTPVSITVDFGNANGGIVTKIASTHPVKIHGIQLGTYGPVPTIGYGRQGANNAA